jgi:hypothetical protein
VGSFDGHANRNSPLPLGRVEGHLNQDFPFRGLPPLHPTPKDLRCSRFFMLSIPSDSAGPGRGQLCLLRVRKTRKCLISSNFSDTPPPPSSFDLFACPQPEARQNWLRCRAWIAAHSEFVVPVVARQFTVVKSPSTKFGARAGLLHDRSRETILTPPMPQRPGECAYGVLSPCA